MREKKKEDVVAIRKNKRKNDVRDAANKISSGSAHFCHASCVLCFYSRFVHFSPYFPPSPFALRFALLPFASSIVFISYRSDILYGARESPLNPQDPSETLTS